MEMLQSEPAAHVIQPFGQGDVGGVAADVEDDFRGGQSLALALARIYSPISRCFWPAGRA